MRLYTFCNYYLSSIQNGIQTAHIVSELFAYPQEPFNAFMIKDWAVNHKTIVVCNGGNQQSLNELKEFFSNKDNLYPWTSFIEDEQSLNCATTAVGIILPPEVYDVKVEFDVDPQTKERKKVFVHENKEKNMYFRFNDPDSYIYQLIDKVKSAPLAR